MMFGFTKSRKIRSTAAILQQKTDLVENLVERSVASESLAETVWPQAVDSQSGRKSNEKTAKKNADIYFDRPDAADASGLFRRGGQYARSVDELRP